MVYIIGAGAGDPELITVKGQKFLKNADVVIYAGSLVNKKLLEICKEGAKIFNSAEMTLDEIIRVIEDSNEKNLNVARLHTGDPSIYGAIKEQIDALTEKNIDFEIIPGVSSFLAAAASLNLEFTLPGITQTIILTRCGGRTSVPERESIKNLAQHKTSMCIFLSINLIEKVVKDLIDGGLSEETPIAVVQRASWDDEKILRGNLKNIVEKISEEKIDRTAMIIVGECLDPKIYEKSKLYSKNFSHMFRAAK